MAFAKHISLALLLCLIVLAWPAPSTSGYEDWDRAGAAAYLDERMDLWFEKGKKLRTGQEKTTCVSCHTTISYMLARPALRRSMKVEVPTAQEQRILAEVTQRVQTPDAHQPQYEHTESKKVESRGTEAVLNALLLANADAAQGRRERSPATQQAFARMWAMQRADGAWDWLDFGLEPFETTSGVYLGATLAALAAGTAPPDSRATPGLEKLRGYLKANYKSQSLFHRTLLWLASERLPELMDQSQKLALREALAGLQHKDGGWSLESLGPWRWSKPEAPFSAPGPLDTALLAKSDGLATGLIVYTLRQAGFPSHHPLVVRGLAWLQTHQVEVPAGASTRLAWRAHSLNFDREHGGDKGDPWRRLFMSDLATAFAVLALTS